VNLFQYDSYKEYLSKEVLSSTKISQLILAKYCGCQPSYLSRVLGGKAHLTHDQAISLCEKLRLDLAETEFFLILMDYEKVGTSIGRKFFKNKIDKIRNERSALSRRFNEDSLTDNEMQALYYSSWYFSAIHILACCDTVKSSDEISSRLNLPKQIVDRCLNQLEEIGLIKSNKNGWENSKKFIHLPHASHYETMNHSNWRQKAILNSQLYAEDSIHYSSVQSISRDDLKQFKNLVFKFLEDSRSLVKKSGKEDIICINCDFFLVR
jgi:uncharacterized protein (TIGR02147 family)